MRTFWLLSLSLVLLFSSACTKVPAGHVGVKVYLLGGSKGVDHEVVGVGRYWLGVNEELYLFPTFEQNYVWSKSPHEGSPHDESITFQDKDGTSINADFGISYHINPEKVATVFQKYRKGLEEITDIFLRNYVRDALNKFASQMTVDQIYGMKKGELVANVEQAVRDQVTPIGIEITKLSIIGSFRLPETVTNALNSKIEATQKAQQTENELREATAAAQKQIAKAKGESEATLLEARAEAESMRIRAAAIRENKALIEYEAVQKWDGKLPQYNFGGGVMPFINVSKLGKKEAE